jgi:4-amino-4-deoxy-L-arabinose transferase-like glycosyltransferase
MGFHKNQMNKIPKSIFFLLLISFIIRFSIGLISGAADDDAGDYVTYAIQTAHDNDFRNFLDLNLGRQVFQLWLFCLVCFMKLFGATNSSAILLTSIIGTLNVLIFYKLGTLFYSTRKSFYISIVYSVIPIIVYTSYNPCYETIFIFLFLFSVYYLFRFINESDNKYLLISGVSGSLLAFVHAYGYPVILVILLSFPFLYSGRDFIKKWILFSITLLLLPVFQMIVWKIIYNSFYPYLDLLTHWVSNSWILSAGEITRFLFYCLFSLSFILMLGVISFVVDIKGTLNRVVGLLLIISLILLFFIFSFRQQNDLFKYFFLIFSISFLILKRSLIKENGQVYLFGVLGLVFFTLMIFQFPKRGNPRMFAFIITVLIPVTWYYLEKINKNEKVVFWSFGLVISLLLTAGLILNFTSLKKTEIGFVKGKISSVFQYNIPFSMQHKEDRKIVRWLKKNGISPNDYAIAGIKSNRFVPSNLDMPQNHFLDAFFFTYTHKEGFTKESLDNYLNWINEKKPRFIIWDIDFQEAEYSQVINQESGERKIAFSFNELNSRLSENYQIADTITRRIIVYKYFK